MQKSYQSEVSFWMFEEFNGSSENHISHQQALEVINDLSQWLPGDCETESVSEEGLIKAILYRAEIIGVPYEDFLLEVSEGFPGVMFEVKIKDGEKTIMHKHALDGFCGRATRDVEAGWDLSGLVNFNGEVYGMKAPEPEFRM